MNQNDGDLFVATAFVGPDDELDAAALQNLLASFGDLRSFRLADSGATVRVCHGPQLIHTLTAFSRRSMLNISMPATLSQL